MVECRKRSDHFVKMIEILYAVVIGRGLFTLANNLQLPEEPANFLSSGVLFFLFSMFIAIRDWNTYHSLIAERPHRKAWRFFLDICILFSFFFLLQISTARADLSGVEITRFSNVCVIYFLLLVLWEVAERGEYSEDVARPAIMAELKWNLGYLALFLGWRVACIWWPNVCVAAVIFGVFALLTLGVRREFA